MKRLLYIFLVGLVLAGIIHILIVLLIPFYAAKDAWANLGRTGEAWKFSTISQPGGHQTVLPLVDPAFGVAACRYDLAESALIVSAEGSLPFWSVAIFDRRGRNIYSFNDRTSIEKKLSLIVVDPVQMAQLRKTPVEEAQTAVVVESNIKKGFVLIRGLKLDESWTTSVSNFLNNATCERFEISDETDASG